MQNKIIFVGLYLIHNTGLSVRCFEFFVSKFDLWIIVLYSPDDAFYNLHWKIWRVPNDVVVIIINNLFVYVIIKKTFIDIKLLRKTSILLFYFAHFAPLDDYIKNTRWPLKTYFDILMIIIITNGTSKIYYLEISLFIAWLWAKDKLLPGFRFVFYVYKCLKGSVSMQYSHNTYTTTRCIFNPSYLRMCI